MRSYNELGAYGVYNLVEAVRVACDPDAREKVVLVVMNDEIHQAFNITKTCTSRKGIFYKYCNSKIRKHLLKKQSKKYFYVKFYFTHFKTFPFD